MLFGDTTGGGSPHTESRTPVPDKYKPHIFSSSSGWLLVMGIVCGFSPLFIIINESGTQNLSSQPKAEPSWHGGWESGRTPPSDDPCSQLRRLRQENDQPRALQGSGRG